MSLKKIISFLLLSAMVFSGINVAYTEEEYTVISVGKPITSIYYGDSGYNNTTPSRANDGNSSTVFYSNAGVDNEDGLIINLQKDYKISYAEILISGTEFEYSILASKTADFSDACEFENKDGKCSPKNEDKDEKFRYIKLSVPKSVAKFRVKEFTVYATDVIVDEPVKIKQLPEFKDEMIPVSLNKLAVSKMYHEDGYMDHITAFAVDGINDSENKNAFISAYSDEDWLRVDLGKATKISHLDITAYPQYKGVRIDNVPDWCVVTASNSECKYNEEFSEYVVLEGDNGIYKLPEEYKDTEFRYFQICKPAKKGVLDAMIVREFTVYADAKDLTQNSALNKPVIVDGEVNLNNKLTDGKTGDTVNYNGAVIDLITPSYIKDVVVEGNDTENIKFYGSVEYTDLDNMKLISENPNERYRYVYIENEDNSDISEIQVNTYNSDVLSAWNCDNESNTYSVKVSNNDLVSFHSYTAVVSQINEDGEVLTTDSEKFSIPSGSEKIFSFCPKYVYGVEKVVCNVLRDDVIALTNPTIFVDGKVQYTVNKFDGIVEEDKNLVECVEANNINNGIKVSTFAKDYISGSDVYSIVIYGPNDYLVGYLSENANDIDSDYQYIAASTDEEGTYYAEVILTDPNLKSYYKRYKFSNTHPTQAEIDKCIAQFQSTDGSDFEDLYNEFYVKNRVIDLGAIPFLKDENTRKNVSNAYIWTRDNASLWSDIDTVDTIDEILLCLQAAVVFESARGETISLSDSLKLYSQIMKKVFIEDYEVIEKLYTFSDTDYNKIFDNFVLCNALAAIKNKPVTDIVTAMKKYNKELKIDLNNIENQKIDIYEVAKKLDNSIPKSYYDGLADEVEDILNKIKKNQQSTPTGGGGGGISPTKTGLAPKVITAPSNQNDDSIDNKLIFNDVSEQHWARKSIEYLSEKGIVKGLPNNVFEPNRDVTRAEFVKMIVTAFSMKTEPNIKVTFDDCAVNDWYYPYVDAGLSNKIISGVSANEFCPNNSITRQDSAVIISNVLVYVGNKVTNYKDTDFNDSNEISSYANDAIKILVACKVINGFDDGSFKPKQTLTRAEASVIIVNLLDYLGYRGGAK